jgi:hypothetical protein
MTLLIYATRLVPDLHNSQYVMITSCRKLMLLCGKLNLALVTLRDCMFPHLLPTATVRRRDSIVSLLTTSFTALEPAKADDTLPWKLLT